MSHKPAEQRWMEQDKPKKRLQRWLEIVAGLAIWGAAALLIALLNSWLRG